MTAVTDYINQLTITMIGDLCDKIGIRSLSHDITVKAAYRCQSSASHDANMTSTMGQSPALLAPLVRCRMLEATGHNGWVHVALVPRPTSFSWSGLRGSYYHKIIIQYLCDTRSEVGFQKVCRGSRGDTWSVSVGSPNHGHVSRLTL